MRWEQIDFKAGLVHVARLKNGLPSTHPIRGPELRALRELRRDYPESPYLFVTERGGPMTPATARKFIARAGELAKLPFPIHPHMLRHSAGYKLANEGHDTRSIQQYLGHRNITHTVRYTELSPERFKCFGRIEIRCLCAISARSRGALICEAIIDRPQRLGSLVCWLSSDSGLPVIRAPPRLSAWRPYLDCNSSRSVCVIANQRDRKRVRAPPPGPPIVKSAGLAHQSAHAGAASRSAAFSG